MINLSDTTFDYNSTAYPHVLTFERAIYASQYRCLGTAYPHVLTWQLRFVVSLSWHRLMDVDSTFAGSSGPQFPTLQ